MSYLVLPNGIPNFDKAVISLWFRVPQTSIDEKLAQWAATVPRFFYVLESVIPLLTFGHPQVGTIYEGDHVNVAVYHYDGTAPIYDDPSYHVFTTEPVSPSYIGVLCTSDGAFLQFNLQKDDLASLIAGRFNRSAVHKYSQFVEPFPPDGYSSATGSGWTGGGDTFTTMIDTSYTLNGRPEYFYIETPHKIAADHWHHLLLSFDLSQNCITHGTTGDASPNETTAAGTDSFCKLWYAIDDVDYRAGSSGDPFYLNMGRFAVDGGDPNAILTETAWNIANFGRGFPYNVALPAPECRYESSQLPSSGAEMGIPASSAYAEHIRKVEMAELQIYTGMVIDTNVLVNRRAFVDADGVPVKPEVAEEFFGKRPEILLHRTNAWKAGKNTGSLGTIRTVDNENIIETIIPTGQFLPVETIKKYVPDPSLHGPQVPPPTPSLSSRKVQLTRTNARL